MFLFGWAEISKTAKSYEVKQTYVIQIRNKSNCHERAYPCRLDETRIDPRRADTRFKSRMRLFSKPECTHPSILAKFSIAAPQEVRMRQQSKQERRLYPVAMPEKTFQRTVER